MKKIFTLLMAAGMFTLVQAQPGTRDSRQNDQRGNQQTDERNNQRTDQRNDQQNDQRNNHQNDQRYDQRNDNNRPGYGNNGGAYDNRYDKDNRYDDRFSMDRRRDMEIARINEEYDYKIQRVQRNFFINWYEKQNQIRCLQEQRQQEISMVYRKFGNNGRRDNDHEDRGNHYGRRW
jgi:hypothetical protein